MPRCLSPMPVLAAVLLAGCTGGATVEGAVSPSLGTDFGNAVQHNAAVQIVDPMPMQARDGAPALDGYRAAAAIVRYQNGAVRELEIETTSDIKAD